MDHHVSQIVYRAVEQLSPTQAALIGGVGSGAATVSVLAPALNSGPMSAALQYFTLMMGAIGALLSVGLCILKWVQQRREMRAWREKNTSEHKEFYAAQQVSVDDRQGLHDAQDAISERVDELETCTNHPGRCANYEPINEK